jgi:uncharacterized protein
MLYIDTSVFVAALTFEPESSRIQAWLASQNVDDLVLSEWVITEFSSALALKLRTGQLELVHRNRALAAFTDLVRNSLKVLKINSTHFRSAAKIADQYTLGIRAADALHLALTIGDGATLCTLDRRLAEGGRAVGADTRLL